MNSESNTILITGGASGIGFSLAEHFLKLGNTVVICGRRKDKLEEAQAIHPHLHIKRLLALLSSIHPAYIQQIHLHPLHSLHQ
jgi:short-subunit dehydrogenase involved in D-alanine esterification of teichoic acids